MSPVSAPVGCSDSLGTMPVWLPLIYSRNAWNMVPPKQVFDYVPNLTPCFIEKNDWGDLEGVATVPGNLVGRESPTLEDQELGWRDAVFRARLAETSASSSPLAES